MNNKLFSKAMNDPKFELVARSAMAQAIYARHINNYVGFNKQCNDKNVCPECISSELAMDLSEELNSESVNLALIAMFELEESLDDTTPEEPNRFVSPAQAFRSYVLTGHKPLLLATDEDISNLNNSKRLRVLRSTREAYTKIKNMVDKAIEFEGLDKGNASKTADVNVETGETSYNSQGHAYYEYNSVIEYALDEVLSTPVLYTYSECVGTHDDDGAIDWFGAAYSKEELDQDNDGSSVYTKPVLCFD